MATSAVKRRPKLGLAKTSGIPSTVLRTSMQFGLEKPSNVNTYINTRKYIHSHKYLFPILRAFGAEEPSVPFA